MTDPVREKTPVKADIIIPTYQPGAGLSEMLRRLALQSLRPEKVIIVNTDESCWREDLTDSFDNTEVVHITKEEFRHGRARNLGASLSDADILIFMTQDALPADNKLVERLIRPILSGSAEISYARQLPNKDADPIERITRSFNYPDRSLIKSKDDKQTLGIKTYFCSNVCAAYDRKNFEKIGGFHDELMFNEDMVFAAESINAGCRIAYCADAMVYHSHNYSGIQQYRRNVEIGRSQKQYEKIFGDVPSEGEGMKLVKTTAKELLKTRPLYVFKLAWISGCKYLGYRAGKRSVK